MPLELTEAPESDSLFQDLLEALVRDEPRPTLPPGTRIGSIRIDRVLGQGGMGAVYQATDADGRSLALKTVRRVEESALAGLRLEIQVLRRLDHPSVVPLVEHGIHDGLPWYAMPLLEGPNLRACMDAAQTPELGLIQQICGALDYLHCAGVVHRDLKPDNVVVCGGVPVIIDFGLMAPFGGDRQTREQVQTTGHAAGTAGYMAPEQIRGALADPRTDLYAVGCILFEMVTGRSPFPAKAGVDVPQAHLTQAPPLYLVPDRLRSLIGDLLAKAPAARPSHAGAVALRLAPLAGPPPPSVGAFLHRPVLVGRSEALDGLNCALKAALVGRGGAILLAGESGVGKTRLLTEWSAQAVNAGMTVLAGACRDVGGGGLEGLRGPLQAIADRCRARGAAFTARHAGAAAGLLAAHHPGFRDLPGAQATSLAGLPPEAALRQLCGAVLEVLELAARPRGLVLITDDLQWADSLTARILEMLRTQLAGRPILWVLTWRTDHHAQPPPSLDTISLQRLGLRAIGGMVRDMLATDDVPPGLTRHVAEQARGNPFFIGEHLRTAIEAGQLLRDGGAWRWLGTAGDRLSSNLRDVLAERIERLEPTARQIAEAAAVLGRSFPLELLRATTETDAEVLDDGVEELRRRAVFETRARGGLRFVHHQLREVVIATTDTARRRSLHARAAAVIGPQAPLERRAAHLAGAGWTRQAAEVWAEAAREHLSRGAHADAQAAFSHAAGLTGCPLTIRVEWLGAMSRVGDPDEVRAVADALADDARRAGDGRAEASALTALGWIDLEASALDAAERRLLLADSIQTALGDWGARGRTRSGFGALAADRGALEEAAAHYRSADADYVRAGDGRGRAIVANNLAIISEGRGDLESALGAFMKANHLAEAVGDDWLATITLLNTATMRHQLGYVVRARAEYLAALATFEVVGHPRWLASCLTYQASLARQTGADLDDVERSLVRALSLHANSGAFYRAVTLAELGHVELARGRDARARLDEVSSILGELGIGADTPNEYGAVLARLRAAQGAFDGGGQLFRGEHLAALPRGLRRWMRVAAEGG